MLDLRSLTEDGRLVCVCVFFFYIIYMEYIIILRTFRVAKAEKNKNLNHAIEHCKSWSMRGTGGFIYYALLSVWLAPVCVATSALLTTVSKCTDAIEYMYI